MCACRSDVTSGKVSFRVGKEAVPRHRLQALLAGGDFDRALELARANSMDETDVHAARLLALLRKGGGAAAVNSAGVCVTVVPRDCVHYVYCGCACSPSLASPALYG